MLGFLYLKGSVAGLEYPNGYFLVNLWQGLNYWRTILSKKQKDERYRDKEWLEEKYVGEELTMEEIGSLCGIHRKTIRYWFKKFGIQSGNNRKYEGKNNPRWKDSKCKDKEWLVQKYSIERLTLKDISLLCGVSECVVGRYLKKFGVSAVNEMRKYMGKEYNSGKWLYQKYIIEGLGMMEIANICDVTTATINNNLINYGIAVRKDVIDKLNTKIDNAWGEVAYIKRGYVRNKVTNHPNCNSKGYVLEHRLVMERHIGRYLNSKEIVHHIDGDRSNNVIENLMLLSNKAEHTRLHRTKKEEKCQKQK